MTSARRQQALHQTSLLDLVPLQTNCSAKVWACSPKHWLSYKGIISVIVFQWETLISEKKLI